MVSKQNRQVLQMDSAAEQHNDPVVRDQGGRMTHADPVHPLAESDMPSPEVVRTRAYELYERKGRRDGRALDDWLEAESQLRRIQLTNSRKDAVVSGPTPLAAPELRSTL